MGERRWSFVVTRPGQTGSRRFRISMYRAVALAGLGVVLIGAAFFWLGMRAADRRAASSRAELRAQLDSLTEENAKVVLLAERLAELEGEYEQLRAVMGGEVAPSARDILLPPVRTDGSDTPGARAARPPPSAGRPTVWPLVEAGFITRSFGDTVPGEGAHRGLDIAVPVGSYVRTTGTGVVLETGEDAEYGRFVRIEHPAGFRSLYGHNSWAFVEPGDSVEAGEVIALSGNTGRSTAPHLHLEIEQGGATVDPLPFVSNRQ